MKYISHTCVLSLFSHVWLFAILCTVVSRLLCPWDSPSKTIEVDYHFLFQGIFPIQGSNPSLPHLLHYRQILYHWTTRKAHISQRNILYSCLDMQWAKLLHKIFSEKMLSMHFTSWNETKARDSYFIGIVIISN